MPNNHALLSPSSSHRWLHCTPSVMLEAGFENKTSQAAEEGTAAHALCEHKLKKMLKMRSKCPVSASSRLIACPPEENKKKIGTFPARD